MHPCSQTFTTRLRSSSGNKRIEQRQADYLATDLLFSADPDKHAKLYIIWRRYGKRPEIRSVLSTQKTRLKELYGGSIWAKK